VRHSYVSGHDLLLNSSLASFCVIVCDCVDTEPRRITRVLLLMKLTM
jgi:hypothetical protein